MSINTLQQTLKKRFRISSFRLGQQEIIESILSGRDVLAIMPTGGGKSLCYQLPTLMKSGVTVIVSPLIALMNDQVAALKTLNIPAGCIHSGLSFEQRKTVFTEMKNCSQFFIVPLSRANPKNRGLPNGSRGKILLCLPLMKPIVFPSGGMILEKNMLNFLF